MSRTSGPADPSERPSTTKRGYRAARATALRIPDEIADAIAELVAEARHAGYPTHGTAMAVLLLQEAIEARRRRAGPAKARRTTKRKVDRAA